MLIPVRTIHHCDSIKQLKKHYAKRERFMELVEQYQIKQMADGRYYCNITISKGKYKCVKAKTQQAVREKICDILGKGETIADLYPVYRDDTMRCRSMSTAARYDSDWKKYLAGSDIADMEIAKIDVIDLKKSLMDLVEKHKLTNKKYKDLKTILNGILDRAVEKKIIQVNPGRQIHRISYEKFAKEPKKPQYYTDAEGEILLQCCMDRYQRTKNGAYLAIMLNFTLGLRAGELVTLKPEDFHFDRCVLEVSREEAKEYKLGSDGNFHQTGLKVNDWVKGEYDRREEDISRTAYKSHVSTE